jgi:hypothetical protein
MAEIFGFDGYSPKEIAEQRTLANDSVLRAPYHTLGAAMAVFLGKLAKHLALLVCLLILGKAGGRLTTGPLVILILTIFASAAHLAGRALLPRPRGRTSNVPP